ncbi:hypothetical protein GOBAR_AA33560 [Gossypium barbadense]|uniref:Uncharacterized protein n=1 Tax=Gossypium barbadense TaxID=3634 RepID=A0A2P5W7R0_GOSBA|nr:hypothetical protein GOBAR_AA33560 [Gossypium barbadense]
MWVAAIYISNFLGDIYTDNALSEMTRRNRIGYPFLRSLSSSVGGDSYAAMIMGIRTESIRHTYVEATSYFVEPAVWMVCRSLLISRRSYPTRTLEDVVKRHVSRDLSSQQDRFDSGFAMNSDVTISSWADSGGISGV